MAPKKKLTLTVVEPPGTDFKPPRSLGEHGAKLWDAVQREHRIQDIGGAEVLAQACGAVDRLEALAARVAEDDEIIRTRTACAPIRPFGKRLLCAALWSRPCRSSVSQRPIYNTRPAASPTGRGDVAQVATTRVFSAGRTTFSLAYWRQGSKAFKLSKTDPSKALFARA